MESCYHSEFFCDNINCIRSGNELVKFCRFLLSKIEDIRIKFADMSPKLLETEVKLKEKQMKMFHSEYVTFVSNSIENMRFLSADKIHNFKKSARILMCQTMNDISADIKKNTDIKIEQFTEQLIEYAIQDTLSVYSVGTCKTFISQIHEQYSPEKSTNKDIGDRFLNQLSLRVMSSSTITLQTELEKILKQMLSPIIIEL